MKKCPICKQPVPGGRSKFCSKACGTEGNKRLATARGRRIGGFYAMHHQRQRGCLGCGLVFQPRGNRHKYCSTSCALDGRKLDADGAKITKRTFMVQISDGRIKRRNPTVTMVEGCPTSEQWSTIRHPYLMRDSGPGLDDAWNELITMHQTAEAASNTEMFTRYLMNLAGG